MDKKRCYEEVKAAMVLLHESGVAFSPLAEAKAEEVLRDIIAESWQDGYSEGWDEGYAAEVEDW